MYWLYSALLAIVLLMGSPYWLWQMLRHGKYRRGLGERLGRLPLRLRRPAAPVIWVHAVSVGEVLAVSRLIEDLKSRFPKHSIVVSTTTDTGQKLAGQRFGEENVFYFPLDLPFAIQPYLRLLRPRLVIIAETEFWPNFLRLAHRSGARIAIVNGRISDRSLRGYRRYRRVLVPILSQIDIFLAQSPEDARRLHEIGAPAERVENTGNLKFDLELPPPPEIVAHLRATFESEHAGPIIVCGSTMEGEEPLLLRTFEIVLGRYPKAVMILAPRHPERFEPVAQLIQKLRLTLYRRSTKTGETLAGAVLLLDSVGELAAIYALADIAFVGGSLVPSGGHNILEPAQYGVATVIGHHTENFRDMVEVFQVQKAIRVVGPAELPLVFMELLADSDLRADLGSRAAGARRSQMGATEKTIQALGKLLSPAQRGANAKTATSKE
ncbi:MAG: 3-deoxy-D-manno-octulosonic acid transferase [Acidobacteriales bacterium]|nr:3-deoxy-D-manno-octulosonic acid transferase [Terriglobales bacterium]